MKKLTVILFLLWLNACRKPVELQDVFADFKIENKNLMADGSSTTQVSVELPIDSDPSKRSVIFSASNGSFVGAQQGKLVVKADFENGKLIARGTYRASLKPGDASITVSPEKQSPYKDYTLKDQIILAPSLPHSVRLEYSAPAVRANYQNEIFLKAIVLNDKGKNVSEGVEVRFTEFSNSSPSFSGRYRYSNKGNTTSDSSSVSTFFSVGNVPVPSEFFIRAEVYENGAPTGKLNIVPFTVIN